ncbi:group I truncated hemoglobin [Kribbella sp. CA-247076]|uniref:group I truncated hemoglobin n=1 Tax=Kribbella sp. CA-247076 TaxID=3239941 RepID=UPI003D90E8DC
MVEQAHDNTGGNSDYAAVGGGPAVASVVELFYQKVLGDPQLAGYFENTDLARLKRHQVQLVSQVMGGPVSYEGADLAEAHQGRGITGEDFGKVVVHLVHALEEHQVPADIVGRVVTALGATQADIITAS